MQNSLLNKTYAGISELHMCYAAVSQAVCVGENSAGLTFLYRLENPIGHPPTLW
jgi:hypothetical protein